MGRVTRLLWVLLLPILVLCLSACAASRQVGDTEEVSDGPTVYGQISVSVDHESVRCCRSLNKRPQDGGPLNMPGFYFSVALFLGKGTVPIDRWTC